MRPLPETDHKDPTMVGLIVIVGIFVGLAMATLYVVGLAVALVRLLIGRRRT